MRRAIIAALEATGRLSGAEGCRLALGSEFERRCQVARLTTLTVALATISALASSLIGRTLHGHDYLVAPNGTARGPALNGDCHLPDASFQPRLGIHPALLRVCGFVG